MSTEIGTLHSTGSRNVDMYITRYWGGVENGVCVQLTAKQDEEDMGYIQLSVHDLLVLIPLLQQYIINYSFREIILLNKFTISEEIEGEEND